MSTVTANCTGHFPLESILKETMGPVGASKASSPLGWGNDPDSPALGISTALQGNPVMMATITQVQKASSPCFPV